MCFWLQSTSPLSLLTVAGTPDAWTCSLTDTFSLAILIKALEDENLTLPCHSEVEPVVQALLVSDITPESFSLTWTAEEDAFDTFVLMISQAEGSGQPKELVLGGEERNTAVADLIEDTEYKVEIFGLILGRRSKSLTEQVKTGTR